MNRARQYVIGKWQDRALGVAIAFGILYAGCLWAASLADAPR